MRTPPNPKPRRRGSGRIRTLSLSPKTAHLKYLLQKAYPRIDLQTPESIELWSPAFTATPPYVQDDP